MITWHCKARGNKVDKLREQQKVADKTVDTA